MGTWTPDPTFYPSARLAMQTPPEKLAYVVILSVAADQPDALGVVDRLARSTGERDIPARAHFLVGRKGSMSVRWVRRAATVREAFFYSITTHSMCSAAGRWTGAHSIWRTTLPGIWATTLRSPASGAHLT